MEASSVALIQERGELGHKGERGSEKGSHCPEEGRVVDDAVLIYLSFFPCKHHRNKNFGSQAGGPMQSEELEFCETISI